MNTPDRTRVILMNATLLTIDIDPAMRALEEAQAGWPTSTPGAGPVQADGDTECGHRDCNRSRPCPVHGDHDGTRNDKATDDLDYIAREVADLEKRIRNVADRAHQWATSRIDGGTVERSLALADADLWCQNCVQYGHRNVRTNGNYCEFCSDVKSKHKRYPNEQLLDIKHSRRVYVSDIHMCFRKVKAPVRKQAADKKAAAERQAERLRA